MSPQQQRVLNAIAGHLEEAGTQPTYAEIARRCGLRRQTVYAHVRALVRMRRVTRASQPRARRSITLAPAPLVAFCREIRALQAADPQFPAKLEQLKRVAAELIRAKEWPK